MARELIVMGGSWGGFSALRCVLGGLPAFFKTPIAIAQHRRFDSSADALALLGAPDGLVIQEIQDKEPIEPGHIYVAPADYHVLVEPDGFALSIGQRVQFSRPSIDVLFESAADVYAERLIGVILTGTNEDGAAGLARVKQRGGVTVVQDPATAERPSMPEAAIATGAADRVLPLERIGPFLTQVCVSEPVLYGKLQ